MNPTHRETGTLAAIEANAPETGFIGLSFIREKVRQERCTTHLGQVTCSIEDHSHWCIQPGDKCPDCGAAR